jgi:hypothetical protein
MKGFPGNSALTEKANSASDQVLDGRPLRLG